MGSDSFEITDWTLSLEGLLVLDYSRRAMQPVRGFYVYKVALGGLLLTRPLAETYRQLPLTPGTVLLF